MTLFLQGTQKEIQDWIFIVCRAQKVLNNWLKCSFFIEKLKSHLWRLNKPVWVLNVSNFETKKWKQTTFDTSNRMTTFFFYDRETEKKYAYAPIFLFIFLFILIFYFYIAFSICAFFFPKKVWLKLDFKKVWQNMHTVYRKMT